MAARAWLWVVGFAVMAMAVGASCVSCAADSRKCCRADTFCGMDTANYFGCPDDKCCWAPKWHVMVYMIGDNDFAGHMYKNLEWYRKYMTAKPQHVSYDIFVDWDVSELKAGFMKKDTSRWGYNFLHVQTNSRTGAWKRWRFNSPSVQMTSYSMLKWFLDLSYSHVPRAENRILILMDHAGPLSFGIDYEQCEGSGRSCSEKYWLTSRAIRNAIKDSKIRKVDIFQADGCNWMTMSNALWLADVSRYTIASQTFAWFSQNRDVLGGSDVSVFNSEDLPELSVYEVATRIAYRTAVGNQAGYKGQPSRYNVVVLHNLPQVVRAATSALQQTTTSIMRGTRERATNLRRRASVEHWLGVDLSSWAEAFYRSRDNVLQRALDDWIVYHTHTSDISSDELGGLSEYYPSDEHQYRWDLFKRISGPSALSDVWYNYILWLHNEQPYTRPRYSNARSLPRGVLGGGLQLGFSYGQGGGSVQSAMMFAMYEYAKGAFKVFSGVQASVTDNEMSLYWRKDIYFMSVTSDPDKYVDVFYTDTQLREDGVFAITIPFIVDKAHLVDMVYTVRSEPEGTPDSVVRIDFISLSSRSSGVIGSSYDPKDGSKWYPQYPSWRGPDVNPLESLWYNSDSFLTFTEGDSFVLSGIDLADDAALNLVGEPLREMSLEFVSTTFAGDTISAQLVYNAFTDTIILGRAGNQHDDKKDAAGVPDFDELQSDDDDDGEVQNEAVAANDDDDDDSPDGNDSPDDDDDTSTVEDVDTQDPDGDLQGDPVCIDANWIDARGLAKVHDTDGIGELLCIVGLDDLPCGTADHVLELTIAGADADGEQDANVLTSGAQTVLMTYAQVCAARACTSKVGRFNGVLHSDAHLLPSQDGLRVTTVSHRGSIWSALENRIVVAALKTRASWLHDALTRLQRRNSAQHLS
eukprot:CAMPEP_0185843810 /NCGR_PEP_ID=MMETSP1354-20130828/206_1 /TAXON_ID=708628 /ORGANISM="Erythrolobus madagascarensis, Strain CCMP3276" /LENGTH=917 /DNA_ID=CAMNT_0028543369 /DNA_START=55 /DNA_END=2808 /DNA_ORIENTATION=+